MAESIISPMERLESSPLKDSWPGAYAHLKKLIQASEANRAKEEAEESGSAISQDENGHNRSKESTSPKQDKDF